MRKNRQLFRCRRDLLSVSRLDEFAMWLNEYTNYRPEKVPKTAIYECLRIRLWVHNPTAAPGILQPGQDNPISFYKKDKTRAKDRKAQHITVPAEAVSLVQRFLWETKRAALMRELPE